MISRGGSVLADGDLSSIRWWPGWADRSRLEPFRKLSPTLKEHFHGILAYLETRLTNAAIEAVNGLLQMAKRIARGFRNFHYFRIAAYLKAVSTSTSLIHYPLETSKTQSLAESNLTGCANISWPGPKKVDVK
jgi:hypothetical protein